MERVWGPPQVEEEEEEEPRPLWRSWTAVEGGAAALGRVEGGAEAGRGPGNRAEEAAEGGRSGLGEGGAGGRSWEVEVGGSPGGPPRRGRGAGAEAAAAAGGPREPVGAQRRVSGNLWPSGGGAEEGTPGQAGEEEGRPSEEEEEEEEHPRGNNQASAVELWEM